MSTQERCGVVYKGRPPCRQRAGWGTDHKGFGPCKNHGGTLQTVRDRQMGAMLVADAMKLIPAFGEAVEQNPEQALLDLVSQSAALVSFYGEQVNKLAEKELPDTVAGTFMRAVQGYEQGSGLFGPEIAVDKDGTEHIIGEKLRGMVVLWNEERDRLSKYAKTALGAGIERRRVELAERYGERIVVVVNNVLVAMGIPPDRLPEARTLIAAQFRELDEAGE